MSDASFSQVWRWQRPMARHLRHSFEGADLISQNYSQSWQDIFILSVLRGLRGGRYLEVGGHVPIDNNNTYLLHKDFGWWGVTLEMDPAHFPYWLAHRPKSTLAVADALQIDYADALPRWFGSERRIDYLQLDIDPSIHTLGVLQRLPLDDFRFSVITFETDAYAQDYRARDESREILARHGYELVARDVLVMYAPASPTPIPFEDWWVDPKVVSWEIIRALQRLNATTGLPQELLFSAQAGQEIR